MFSLVSGSQISPHGYDLAPRNNELTKIQGSHPLVIASLAIFGVCFPVFLYVQSYVSRPIMPLYLVRRSPRMNLIFSNFFAALLSNAILFNM